MNRRQLIATLPALGLAGTAFAQPPAAPQAGAPPAAAGAPPAGAPPGAGRGGGRGGAPAAPVEPALPMTILATGLQFPEAPVWMRDGSVLFVQIPKGEISRLTPDGKVELWCKTGDSPNGLAFGPDGALYVANDGNRFGFTPPRADGSATLGGASPMPIVPGKIQRVDPRTKAVTTLFSSVEGKEMLAPDDLVFGPDGSLWVSEYGRAAGTGAIYWVSPDLKTIKIARANLNSPNGIGVSPDGKMLHVSMGGNLLGFDITAPGVLATTTYPNNGVQAPLNGTADSLKVMADGTVAVCSLLRPGGIGLHRGSNPVEFLAFPDRFTTNLAFGGADYRDAWLTFSDTGRIAKVRWPSAGLKPKFPR